HVNFADPYCPVDRRVVLDNAGGVGIRDGGAMVGIEGPRFSTPAESRWDVALGAAAVNMAGPPQAAPPPAPAVRYPAVALVTDLDAGVEGDHGVTQEEVFRVFAQNTERLRTLLMGVLPKLPDSRDCPCARALDEL